MAEQDSTGRPIIEITLVHGTWGRMRLPFSGPRWFEEGSEFVINLRRLLESSGADVRIQPLLWSGKNSLEARRRAAARLKISLWRQASRNAACAQVIIGHSHGGSICTLALRGLADGLDPIVITLGTPFVEVVNAEPTGRTAAIRGIVSGGFGPMLLIFTMAMVEAIFEIPGLGVLFHSYGALTVAANILTAVYGLPGKDQPKEPEPEFEWLAPEKHDFRFYTQSTIGGATIDPPRRMLILRGVDDEAGLVLAAGAIGTRTVSTFVSLSFRTTTILTVAFVAIAALGMADSYLPQLVPAKEFVRSILLTPYLIYPAYGCVAAMYLLPLVSGLFKCVYGRELVFGGYFCDIKSASVPDATSGLTVVTLPPSNRSGMRHRIYRNEGAPGVVANFIKSALSKPDATFP